MILCNDKFKEALSSPVSEVHVKMELLDKNEKVLDVFTQHVSSDSSGSVSVSSDRDIRRMFSLTLDNSSGEFTWAENGKIWIDNKRVKLYVGLKCSDGTIEYVPQGVFIITQPEATHTVDDNEVKINGQDKWYLLTGNFGRFTHETTVRKGTNVREAIKIIAEGAGITKMMLDPTDQEVLYDMTFQIGQNRGEAIKQMVEKAYLDDEYFYDVYFDVNGYLRFTKYRDPLKEYPCWSYRIEDGTLYAGSVRKLDDSELFNHILVLGGSANTAEFRSEVVIDDTDSEWSGHPYSIQKIGDRFWCWNNNNPDSNIDTQSQCDARAKFELKRRLKLSEIVAMDIAPNYLHEPNDVIEIVDEKNGCVGNYQVKSFSIPIQPNEMSVEAIKVREG
jgi:hypothetical protein